MKQLYTLLFVLACTTNLVFAQVTLSIGSENPQLGDTFDIDVTVQGFDSLSSALFKLKWDPDVISLVQARIPVDTFTNPNDSPYESSSQAGGITFLYDDRTATGISGSLPDGSSLLKLTYTTRGARGDSTCIEPDASRPVEFIKLAREELSHMVLVGCVYLPSVNSLQSQEQQNLNCHWQSSDRLTVSHPASVSKALIELYALDGRRLHVQTVEPRSSISSIPVSQDWQRTLLIVRYTLNGFSTTKLIPGPR